MLAYSAAIFSKEKKADEFLSCSNLSTAILYKRSSGILRGLYQPTQKEKALVFYAAITENTVSNLKDFRKQMVS